MCTVCFIHSYADAHPVACLHDAPKGNAASIVVRPCQKQGFRLRMLQDRPEHILLVHIHIPVSCLPAWDPHGAQAAQHAGCRCRQVRIARQDDRVMLPRPHLQHHMDARGGPVVQKDRLRAPGTCGVKPLRLQNRALRRVKVICERKLCCVQGIHAI